MKIQRRQRYPILIYMLGFFLGIIYLNVASTRYVVDVGIWSEWFRSQYLGYDLKSFDYMWYIAQIRLLPAGGLAILGGTKFRKIAAYLFLFMGWTGKWHDSDIGTSYAGSQKIDIMHYKYASAFLCYIPAYAMLFTIFIPISGERMEFYEDVKFCIISYYGIALECLVNPVLLKMFLRNTYKKLTFFFMCCNESSKSIWRK